jgi:RecB family endonuclease NucS
MKGKRDMVVLEKSSSYKFGELPDDAQRMYAHECRIRNAFARDFKVQRPSEKVLSRETRYAATALRADLRSIDTNGLFREWEFKIDADHYVLGQILTYIAHARREMGFRPVRGVIAAFSFTEDLRMAIEVMNLNIELVTVPLWMSSAGGVPNAGAAAPKIPSIPQRSKTA